MLPRVTALRSGGALLGLLLVACACATPVGVNRVDTQSVYRSLTASVLSTGTPGPYSQQLLQRLGLSVRFEKDPEAVLAGLRGSGAGLSREYLFALAELSFFHAEQTQQREYYLGSAVYAYAFLFADRTALDGDPLDPRVRLAADLYNLGLVHGLAASDGESVALEPGSRALPFGRLDIAIVSKSLRWSSFRMVRFVAVGEFAVRGFLNRYRQAGIGAPLAAELSPVTEGPEGARKRIPPLVKVPVTALLRIENVGRGIVDGQVRGEIEIYPADSATTAQIDGRTLPLELEPTGALAYMLEGAPVWDTELGSFLSALRPPFPEGLIMLHPYRPGRVPIVLIHGTASSPARWADLVNELQNDLNLRDRIDVWLFTYNTSNPILLSAADLRASLRQLVEELDPLGRDPVLRRIVLIGHSQGGLLARVLVTDSGTRFWDALTDIPFEKVRLAPETRALIERTTFFEALPFVTRVVFVATPHRGSFRVSSFVLGILRRLIALPSTVVDGFKDVAERNERISLQALGGIPNAVDNMRPGQRFVRTLASSPIAPGVAAHSIIAVPGEGPPAGQNDGVVVYESAHLDEVVSEKIVRSGHSVQGNPEAILELRRILYEHLGLPCGLECEVPARVEGAMLSVPRAEKVTFPRVDSPQGP